jgi:hypothetical protein
MRITFTNASTHIEQVIRFLFRIEGPQSVVAASRSAADTLLDFIDEAVAAECITDHDTVQISEGLKISNGTVALPSAFKSKTDYPI